MNQKKSVDNKTTTSTKSGKSPTPKPVPNNGKKPVVVVPNKKQIELPKKPVVVSSKKQVEPSKKPVVVVPSKKQVEPSKKPNEVPSKTVADKGPPSSKSPAPSKKTKEVKTGNSLKPDPKSEQSGKESDLTDQETTRRPKKKVKKLRKRKPKPKSAREQKKMQNPALERERLRLQRQELNAMEKRWMIKKEAEFNKKLNELTKSNTEMKSLEEHLLKENELIKNDRSFKELELEKLSQFWTITREQLEDQKHQSIELETRLQRVKSAHIEQISLLHKRISMLQLSTKLEQIASTQTDPFGTDSDCTGYSSVIVQTESDYDRQKVNEILKQHDEELETFIAEIENAKIQAQSDYKFAVIQMEQGLREEHEEELRAVTEEKDRQLEEMCRIQSEQLQLIENEKMHMKAELSGEITNQKVELQQYLHNLEQKDSECNDLFDRLQASEKQNEGLTDKYRALNNKFEKNEIRGQILKKDAKTIGDLRNRLEKIEEINEILLGEYKKLEHERNMFAEQVSYVLKTGLGSSGSQQGSVRDVSVQNKAYEIGEQLDEIRRKYRAI